MSKLNKPLVVLVLTSAVLTAYAACPTTPGRFVPDGAEVTDTHTGLIWKRCSVGQNWGGSTCTGSISVHSHQAALQISKNTAGWRLPNIKELASLADKGCQNPTIDTAAFPATFSSAYWSSSPNVGGTDKAWNVYFDYGYVYLTPRSNSNAVRLVRTSQ